VESSKKATMESWSFIGYPGLNYRVHLYDEASKNSHRHFGSETASTVSSRGIYKFPVVQEEKK
jgi:beta-galactosidase